MSSCSLNINPRNGGVGKWGERIRPPLCSQDGAAREDGSQEENSGGEGRPGFPRLYQIKPGFELHCERD